MAVPDREREMKYYTLIDTIETSLQRSESIRDQKVKTILLFDKLSTILDVVLAHETAVHKRQVHTDESINLDNRYQACITKIRNEIRTSLQWVQDAQPSPVFQQIPPPPVFQTNK